MTEVLCDIKDNVGTITLNRPDVLNALSPTMAQQLQQHLEALCVDADVKCIVLRGAGTGFMAGGDLGYFHSMMPRLRSGDTEGLAPLFDLIHAIVETIRNAGTPVLAGLHGAVAGFGVSLAAACDLAIAAQGSRFTLAYCRIATCPDGSSTYTLPRCVGLKKAMELALLGDNFDAGQALAMGLINKVVDDDKLDDSIHEWATRLAAGPGFAYAKTKQLLYASMENDFPQQIALEEACFRACAQTRDFEEGIDAFLNKRQPNFGGSGHS